MDTFFSSEEQKKMVLENQRLVYYIIKRFNIDRADFDDYKSVGTIGLIKAILTFDTSKNVKFGTYASRCIENEIRMYIRKEKKHKAEVSLNEAIIKDLNGNVLRVEDLISDDEDFAENLVDDQVFVDFINIVLNQLTQKERLIMLYKISGVSQVDIAKIIHISQSYVSRVEKKLSKKIELYLYNQKLSEGVFRMTKSGDTYKISFYSKDVEKFNEVLASVLESTENADELPSFKVVHENGRVRIIIPAHPESFSFIAKIIQKIEEYTVSFISSKK